MLVLGCDLLLEHQILTLNHSLSTHTVHLHSYKHTNAAPPSTPAPHPPIPVGVMEFARGENHQDGLDIHHHSNGRVFVAAEEDRILDVDVGQLGRGFAGCLPKNLLGAADGIDVQVPPARLVGYGLGVANKEV